MVFRDTKFHAKIIKLLFWNFHWGHDVSVSLLGCVNSSVHVQRSPWLYIHIVYEIFEKGAILRAYYFSVHAHTIAFLSCRERFTYFADGFGLYKFHSLCNIREFNFISSIKIIKISTQVITFHLYMFYSSISLTSLIVSQLLKGLVMISNF